MPLLLLFFILLSNTVTGIRGLFNDLSTFNFHLGHLFGYHLAAKCFPNKQWYLLKNINEWKLADQQMLVSTFPVDAEKRNFVREVKNALFSEVYPTPLKNPKLAAVSEDALISLLDLDPSVKYSNKFTHFVSGSLVLPGVRPLAHR